MSATAGVKPYELTLRFPMSIEAHQLTDKVLALEPADLARVKLCIDLALTLYADDKIRASIVSDASREPLP